jgi:hypothetical protein
MKRLLLAAMAFTAATLAVGRPSAIAQVTPTNQPQYLVLGQARAMYYRPASGPAPHVAFLAVHRTSDYLQHPSCLELPQRGFAALCMNTRYINNEFAVDWDRMAIDVKGAVEFLRKQPGIDTIVFFAHSGGGPTLSFYQAVAENGVKFCQDPRKIWPCRDDLANLPKADAIVFADAHPGAPTILLRSLNPAVIDEKANTFDPSLDPYDPRNGYNPTGVSTYAPEFQKRYYAAQSRRMNRLVDQALDREAAIKAGKGPFPDNDIFLIPNGGNPGAGAGGNSQLQGLDTNLDLRSTSVPRKLLKNDGSIVEQVVHSVGPPDLDAKKATSGFDTGAKLLSLTSFLSTQAIRSTNSKDGIDICSSNVSTACAVQSISVPIMFAGMGAHYFIRDSEDEFMAAKSADKDLVYIEGALHGFAPCPNCGVPASTYANSQKNLFDYVAAWTNKRFPPRK